MQIAEYKEERGIRNKKNINTTMSLLFKGSKQKKIINLSKETKGILVQRCL